MSSKKISTWIIKSYKLKIKKRKKKLKYKLNHKKISINLLLVLKKNNTKKKSILNKYYLINSI